MGKIPNDKKQDVNDNTRQNHPYNFSIPDGGIFFE
jgi:hypothetical protein